MTGPPNKRMQQTGRVGVAVRSLRPVVEARPAADPQCSTGASGWRLFQRSSVSALVVMVLSSWPLEVWACTCVCRVGEPCPSTIEDTLLTADPGIIGLV